MYYYTIMKFHIFDGKEGIFKTVNDNALDVYFHKVTKESKEY